jgi:hypothetical protein
VGCGLAGIEFGRLAKVLDRLSIVIIPVGDNSELPFAVIGLGRRTRIRDKRNQVPRAIANQLSSEAHFLLPESTSGASCDRLMGLDSEAGVVVPVFPG